MIVPLIETISCSCQETTEETINELPSLDDYSSSNVTITYYSDDN